MSLLGIAYVAIGAAVGYNGYHEMRRGRFALDLLVAATGEDSTVSPKTLQRIIDATLLGLAVFSAVAWPVVVFYDEVEKGLKQPT